MKKKLIIGSLFVVLALVVLVFISSNQTKPNIKLVVSPSVATVTVDGQTTKTTSLYLSPGSHTVKASFSGFANFSQTIVAKKSLRTIAVILIPNSEAGLQWLVDHPSEAQTRESYGSLQSTNTVNNLLKKMPIINSLPHVDNFYRVDYGQSEQYPNDPTKLALYVHLYGPEGKQQAIDWLTYEGVDIATTEIIYINPDAGD